MAQEIHIDYSEDFLRRIEEGEMDDGMFIDPNVTDEELYPDLS